MAELGLLGQLPLLRRWLLETHCAHTRRSVQFVLDRLVDVARITGPKFVLAHIVSPHPPFVFNADGTPRTLAYSCKWGDGDMFRGSRQEYLEGYRGEIAYLDQALTMVIESIMGESETPPVIIVQSDHGSGVGLVWESIQRSDVRERLGILNAYYLPGEGSELYASISPVNTFRVVFNRYSGTALPLLPDESYMSTWLHPYRFVRVPADR